MERQQVSTMTADLEVHDYVSDPETVPVWQSDAHEAMCEEGSSPGLEDPLERQVVPSGWAVGGRGWLT